MPAPIDPHDGAARALRGRVVTMDDARRVVHDGVVYIRGGAINAIQNAVSPPPDGFEGVPVAKTDGTIFPGLIELHNHLPYNVLPLWQVPKRYTNRDQWGSAGNPDYRKLISGPMKLLGPREEYISAIVRYVECKALIGGTTTTQGVALFSNSGARRFYRGIVRNVEQTDDPALPESDAHIADIDAKSAETFYKRLQKPKKMLLHLSEGTDAAARAHFTALHLADGRWALSKSLVAIHSVALRDDDLGHLHARGASMVWSPLSNLLLYGQTAPIADARKRGIRIGIGADWSPSGSKNVLGEMRVAAAVSELEDLHLGPDDIVAMATSDAARILGWQKALGSIEAGKLADLVVIADDAKGNPYKNLLGGDETKIALVMIGGTGRYGTKSLLGKCGTVSETLELGGKSRALNLSQPTEDPVVAELSLAEATNTLEHALATLPELARKPVAVAVHGDGGRPHWMLALDELAENRSVSEPAAALAAPSLADIVKPLKLDPISRADDHDYTEKLARQPNLPVGLVALLA